MFKWAEFFVNTGSIEVYERLDDAKIQDAHCHLGIDQDGHRMSTKTLLKKFDDGGIQKGVIFPLNDIIKQKCFEISNDRIYKAFSEYPDRFIPFFRLDPNSPVWKEEFERRVSQGFRGVKLHPRSQKFRIDFSEAKKIYELAEMEGLPMLMHVGFGLEDNTDKLLSIIKEYPDLKIILGHSAFVDIVNVLDSVFKNKNVFFDTSVVKLYDLFFLMERMNPKRILYGSDIPYGEINFAVQSIVSVAVALGLNTNSIKDILGGNLERILK